jgi:hypothetical protein
MLGEHVGIPGVVLLLLTTSYSGIMVGEHVRIPCVGLFLFCRYIVVCGGGALDHVGILHGVILSLFHRYLVLRWGTTLESLVLFFYCLPVILVLWRGNTSESLVLFFYCLLPVILVLWWGNTLESLVLVFFCFTDILWCVGGEPWTTLESSMVLFFHCFTDIVVCGSHIRSILSIPPVMYYGGGPRWNPWC